MALNPFKFSPTIVNPNNSKRSIVELLPGVNQTSTITNFIGASADHLFRPGSGIAINGYVGDVPAWNNPSTDYYISEPDRSRAFYQLEPTMTSKNKNTNQYTNVLFYTDLINQLSAQGAVTNNHSRLFDENFYSWAPRIDLDKFINFRKYWWLDINSSYPDYLTISSKSFDKNPWSVENTWTHDQDLTDTQKQTAVQATRPIIEFLPNMELFNYGRYRRLDTDYMETSSVDIQSFNGAKSVTINGINISTSDIGKSGIRVLITNNQDPDNSNKIYNIVVVNRKFVVTTESDGQDPYGSPTLGEITRIKSGTLSGQEFWFNGTSWVKAQSKNDVNQFPLFTLYDFNGYRLDDASEYPNSTFSGSRIFSYNVNSLSTATMDSVLGFAPTYDVNGQLQFCDYCSSVKYSFSENNTTNEITGYYFYKVMSSDGLDDQYTNNWMTSPLTSRQMVVDRFVANGYNKSFTISQIPDVQQVGKPANITVRVSTQGTDGVSSITTSYLNQGTDYLIDGRNIIINKLSENDGIEVRTYSSNPLSDDADGFYELPINLTANPLNDNVALVTLGDVYNQFTEIMSGQTGFSGQVYNINNWRNLSNYDMSIGTSIVQNSSSILPLMLTCSDTDIDITRALRYGSDEYIRFKNRFDIAITSYYTNGVYSTLTGEYSEWVNAALSEISKGMTSSSPFYNSQMGVNTTNPLSYFIPPTPAFLGMAPIYQPAIITDYTIPSNPSMILGHDGSTTVCYGDFRDQVVLELETRIYKSIPADIRAREVPLLDINNWYSNQSYTAQYSRDEYLSIIQSEFDRFAAQYNFDRTANTTFDISNPFSYNWSSVQSNIDSQMLKGSWRAIYEFYYGTDRPHTNPWEMFGFSNKPSWWDGRYGVTNDPAITDPVNYYTSDNRILWNDVRDGYIADGPRKGNHAQYARPLIYQYIPVDEQGYLLDPYQAGIAKNYPEVQYASESWNFGDRGSLENLWMRSSSYSFARTLAIYLMKPARFIGEFWDSLNKKTIFSDNLGQQEINALLGQRDQFYELYVHGETVDNTFIQRYGIQQMISNNLLENNKSISSSLGDPIRGIGVNLSHKMAGFTDSNDITVATDTNDIIPSENINVLLYRSPNVKSSYYSGVIVTKSVDGWKVYGYDNVKPWFNIISPNINKSGETLSVGTVKANTVSNWKPNTYYPKGVIVRTDSAFLLCIKSHTSGMFIESEYWTNSSRQDFSLNNSAIWYNYGVDTNLTTKISYGTEFTSLQDLVNFLNGLQRYQIQDGWVFETISETGTINDWMNAALQMMHWQTTNISSGDFISISPLSQGATFTTAQGEVQNIEQIINGQYGIVDKTGAAIEPYNTSVTRSNGTVEITLSDNTSSSLFGLRLYVSELEHIVIFDNQTVFNDIIYDPVMNVRQPRLKIQGYKTSDWNGRLDAPGFVISGNILIPNFEKTTDDFRHFYDIESIDNDSLQQRARANIGFYERPYMTNLSMSSTNQLEFYQGMIQDKGTPTVFNRLMRSDFIRNNKNISYHEEWAFRVGTYGADSIRPSVDFVITHDNIKNDPQLLEFNSKDVNDSGSYSQLIPFSGSIQGSYAIPSDTSVKTLSVNKLSAVVTSSSTNTSGSVELYGLYKGNKVELLKSYDVSASSDITIELDNDILLDNMTVWYNITGSASGSINIEINYQISSDSFDVIDDNSVALTFNDIKSNQSGKYIVKDSKWIQRFGIDNITWPSKIYDPITPSFFPNAGYVNVNTVDWSSTTADNFYSLYHTAEENNPSVDFSSTYNYVQKGSGNRVLVVDLIKSQQVGYFRVNRIQVSINKSPLIYTTINVGTQSQLPDGVNNTYSSTTIARFTNDDLTSSASSITIYPSTLWKLDGSDNTIKLQFCMNDSSAIPNSLTIADISVSVDLDWITDSILPDQRAWVYNNGNGDWNTYSLNNSGFNINTISAPSFTGQGSVVALKGYNTLPQNKIPSTSMMVLSGVQNISPDITTVLKPKYSNSVSVIVDGSQTSVPIMTFSPDAGMQINNLSINVLTPFKTSDGSNLEFDIGTVSNNTLLSQSSVLSNPVPTIPDFTASTPVTVKLANTNVVISDNTQAVSIHIVKYGNIYGIPQSCDNLPVTSVDWQYSVADPNTGAATTWVNGGSVTFGNPDSSTDIKETYWHMVGTLNFTQGAGTYLIRLNNATNALIQSNNISTIVPQASATATTFDPTSTGSQAINTDLFNINNDNDQLYVTVGSNTSGLAVITLSYEYTNGFELFNVDDSVFSITDNGNGGNVLWWIDTRYSSISEATSDPRFQYLPNNSYLEIDNNGSGLWIIGTKNGSGISTTWTQSSKVETDLLKSAIVYDYNTSSLEDYLEVYDPYKGFIPAAAATEVKYILEYDPAVYNNGTNGAYTNPGATWGKEQTGLLWWDISSVRYLDYENIDLAYRWENWGKICPGTSVDIYEWVRSPVPPSGWSSYVSNNSPSDGFASNPSGTVVSLDSWVETSEWFDVISLEKTVYYFWVLSPSTIPQIENRTKSATAITSIIMDPVSNGISYYAVIDSNHVILGNIKNFVTNESIVKLQWDIGTNTGNFHKQWCLLREGDDSASIDPNLWKKLTDSMVGFDSAEKIYEITGTINNAVTDGESNNISITVESGDLSVIPAVGEIRIDETWLIYNGRIGNSFFGIINDSKISYPQGTNFYIRYNRPEPNIVPDPSLGEKEALGNLIRPLQSWFPVENNLASRSARKVFIDIMNSIFITQPFVDNWYNWQTLFESQDSVPDESLYNYQAPDFVYRNQMVTNNIVEVGNTVFVPGQQETSGFWTLWQYNPSHPLSDAEGFVLINAQKWRLQEGDFWEYADWYATGWSADQFPMYRFDTLAQRDSTNIDVTLLNGTLVEVANSDWINPKWVRYIYTSNGWTEVAKEKATFKLLDTFATNTSVYGYNNLDLSLINSRDGSRELKYILDNMASVMSASQITSVFFTMVRLAVAMDPNIDWAFKTSYMYLGGYAEQLNQEPVAFVDQMDNITSFIKEVKPYHVTIRDYISVYSAGPDIARIHATDFDFPVYQDPQLVNSANRFRVLSPETIPGTTMYNPTNANTYQDTQIAALTFPWADWYNNYSLTNRDRFNWTPERNPVRSTKIEVKFDRVVCDVQIGWDPLTVPWDVPITEYDGNTAGINSSELFYQYRNDSTRSYTDILVNSIELLPNTSSKNGNIAYILSDETTYMWINNSWQKFDSLQWDTDNQNGEATRISKWYEPTIDMPKKDVSCLLVGCGFRGTLVEGGPIEQGLWDMFPLDENSGWANEFAYYDGGANINSSIDTNYHNQITGTTAPIPVDVTGRDFDVTSAALGESLDVDGIYVDGNQLVQPMYDSKHPEEAVPLQPLASLVFVVTDNDGTKFTMTCGNNQSWEYVKLVPNNVTVESDDITSITLTCPNGFVLHDPANPSDDYLKLVKASYVDTSMTPEEIKEITGRLLPGSILVQVQTNGGNSWEKIQYWDVVDNKNGTFTIGALQRNYSGIVRRSGQVFSDSENPIPSNSTVFDTSVVNWMTPRNQYMKNNTSVSPNISYQNSTRNGTKVWTLGNIVLCPQ